MLLKEKDFVEAAEAGNDRPTWVVHDGQRVAKFQYVGTSDDRGYFTLVPVKKNGSRQRTEYLTEYLTERPTSIARSDSSSA
jgi:hypothetical protein